MYDRAKIDSLICKKLFELRKKRKERAKKPGLWTLKYVQEKTGIPKSTLNDLEGNWETARIRYTDLLALMELYEELEDYVKEVVKAHKT